MNPNYKLKIGIISIIFILLVSLPISLAYNDSHGINQGTVNECYVKNEGGHNWGGCALDVETTITAAVGGKLIGALIKNYGDDIAKLVGKNVNKIAGFVNPKALSKVVGSGDEAAAVSKEISDGIEVFAKKGIPADQVLKQLPKEMDDASKVRFFKSLGEFFNNVKVVTWDDVVGASAKNIDELKLKLSFEAKKVMQGSVNSGDELAQVSEALSFDNFAKRGGKLKYVEKDMKTIQGVNKFDYVVEFEGQNYPVSVKRITTSQLTPQNAYDYLSQSVSDMVSARKSLPTSSGYATDNILHYLVKNEDEAKILKQQYEQLIKDDSISVKSSRLITSVGPDYILKMVK